MKKKLIIISVMILVLGVIMGSKQILKKEMKGKESAFKGTYQRERKLYVSNVPSIDQEYTITTNYESNNIGGNIAFMETEEEIRTEVYEEPLKTEVVEEKTPDVNVLKPDEEIIPDIEDNQEKEILGNEQSVLVSDDIKDSINLDNKEPKVKTENKEEILESALNELNCTLEEIIIKKFETKK